MIAWNCKPFDKLTPYELYAILRLRSEVFVVEQNCVFPDMDNNDQACQHLTAWQNETLVACTRIVPPGVTYTEPSIGRVVTAIAARGSGIGRQLMLKSIAECRTQFGNTPIKIGAQLYLKAFYASLGFVPTGGIYREDGIDHIHMVLS